MIDLRSSDKDFLESLKRLFAAKDSRYSRFPIEKVDSKLESDSYFFPVANRHYSQEVTFIESLLPSYGLRSSLGAYERTLMGPRGKALSVPCISFVRE